MSEEVKLLPCLFCGTTPHILGDGSTTYGRHWYTVECPKCLASISDQEKWKQDGSCRLEGHEGECFEAWNTRAPDHWRTVAEGLAERLQAIIDWADFAVIHKARFDIDGTKNLTGPVFNAARKALKLFEEMKR